MKKNIYHKSMYCALLSACMMFSSCSWKAEDQTFPEQSIKVEHNQGEEQSGKNLLGPMDCIKGTENSERLLNEILYGSKDGISKEFLQNFYEFVERSSVHVFQDRAGENQLYAPFNWYLTLSMLGDLTEGEAREEILEVLGISDAKLNASEVNSAIHALEKKRTHVAKLKLNTSLWLDDSIKYQEDKLDYLQNQYRNEIYQGDLKNADFVNQMSEWTRKNTAFGFQPKFNKLLNNANPYAFVSLNTLKFNNEWISPFDENDTTKDSFTLSDHQIITCDFMKMEEIYHPYLLGDTYVSTSCTLKDNEIMLFILPEEGMSVEEFMGQNGELSSIINDWTNKQYTMGKVKLSVPKFAYEKQINLNTVSELMGIKKVFDINSQAFSSFTDDELYIGEITQTSVIDVNEKGCSVSSNSERKVLESGLSEFEVEINLNRPFIYVLYKNMIPFMVGVVQNPIK